MPTSLVALLLLAAQPEVIERVLAVVNGRPLLLSELRVLADLKGLAEDQARAALIDERLMFEQAARVPQAAATEAEVDAACARLGFERPELAARVDAAELRRVVYAEAVILKYVEFRFSPELRVSDSDLERAYAKTYGERPDAPGLAMVAEALKEALARRELDQKIEAWIKELRQGAEIRILP